MTAICMSKKVKEIKQNKTIKVIWQKVPQNYLCSWQTALKDENTFAVCPIALSLMI